MKIAGQKDKPDGIVSTQESIETRVSGSFLTVNLKAGYTHPGV